VNTTVTVINDCHECEVIPFSHEKDPLIREQAKTRQAREAKQRQSEEESACKCDISPAFSNEALRDPHPIDFWNPPMSSDTL
jgi:hypothetical protein